MTVAIVTGGSRGIGAATAKLLAARGYDVALISRRSRAQAEEVADAIRSLGRRALVLEGDVSVEHDVIRFFDGVEEGLGPVQVLVNNAAILARQAAVVDIGADRMRDVLLNNVLSVMLCCREAVRRMQRAGRPGAIVNVSSGAAVTGSPNEYADYAASKGAVESFTRGLAKEVAADGIRVNCVRPGMIHTTLHAQGGEPDRVQRLASRIPMQRGGQAEEVAEAIVWLASDAASFTTGSVLDVTGGL